MILAGFPAITLPGIVILLQTIDPAPIIQSSAILIPGKIILPAPIKTLFPIVIDPTKSVASLYILIAELSCVINRTFVAIVTLSPIVIR